jgi:hypothetical protein
MFPTRSDRRSSLQIVTKVCARVFWRSALGQRSRRVLHLRVKCALRHSTSHIHSTPERRHIRSLYSNTSPAKLIQPHSPDPPPGNAVKSHDRRNIRTRTNSSAYSARETTHYDSITEQTGTGGTTLDATHNPLDKHHLRTFDTLLRCICHANNSASSTPTSNATHTRSPRQSL